MNSVQEILLLFSKYPLPGKSKTRMIPSLGEKGAADLQRKMTTVIASKAYDYSVQRGCRLEIFHQGGNAALMQKWLGTNLSYTAQPPGDIGMKMASAIQMFLGRYRSIVLIGADCPDIDAAVFRESFIALKKHHLVLGPAYDGGYYLIGVRGTVAPAGVQNLFSDISWGSEEVLNQTLEKARSLQLTYHLVKKLHDIDTPEDLRYFDYNPNAQ